MTDITSDTDSRFTIYVPKPLTRINMGKPDPDSPFGYKGISMQTDSAMFVDVNKMFLFQSWKDACFQVVGKWNQWADGGMFLGSVANTTLTSGAKMLVVAGASQPRDMLNDHALGHVTPRGTEYNNLDLHYRIEEIHNGLRKFFYSDKWQGARNVPQGDEVDPPAGPHAVGFATQQRAYRTGEYPAGGFLKKVETFLGEVGYDDDFQTKQTVLQPLEWEGDYLDLAYEKSSVYGPFRTFDPYPDQGFSGPVTLFYGKFVQLVARLKRRIDVVRKLANSITDNFVVRRVQALITAWGNAQDGLNNFLNVADIARFDRETGKAGVQGPVLGAFQDEAGNFGKHLLPFTKKKDATAATGATITSKSGPFDISGVAPADAYILVRDANGGTQKKISFSDISATKATISLTVTGEIRAVTVDTTAVPEPTWDNPTVTETLTLGSATVTFTKAGTADTQAQTISNITSSWSALPAGFVGTPGSTAVKKSDGAAFTASGTANLVVADVTMSTASDLLTVNIDGASKTVSLTGLDAAPNSTAIADERATKLAAAINAQHAGAATAAGGVVTIQSTLAGVTALAEASLAKASNAKLTGGAAALSLSARGTEPGGTAVVVALLHARLAAAGLTCSVAITGSTVTITHNTTGKAAHIDVEGPLASTFFDIKVSDGKDAAPEKVEQAFLGKDFWGNLSDLRNLQFELSKYPEDVRHLLRPVVDALTEAVTAIDKVKGVTDSILAAVFDVQPKTMALGLIAKDGITLGTSAAMYGAGKTITFVAASPGEHDKEKYVLFEESTMKWIGLFDKWTKAKWDQLKPAKKKPGAELKGDFRVAAEQDIVFACARDVRTVALRKVVVDADMVETHGKTSVRIASRTGQLTLQAKSVLIGDVIQDAGELTQNPTETILMQCQNKLDLFTTAMRVQLDNAATKICLGKRNPPGPAPVDDIDETVPRLLIDHSGTKKIAVGYKTPADGEIGLSVEGDGTMTATAMTTLTMSVKNGAGVTIGAADVSIAKDLKVGTALLVKGTAVIPPNVVPPTLPQVVARIAQLPVEYAACIAQATAAKVVITACDLAITTAQEAWETAIATALTPPQLILAAGLAVTAGTIYQTQIPIRRPAVAQLAVHLATCTQLVAEARLLGMPDAQLGRALPLHGDGFFQAPPEPEPLA